MMNGLITHVEEVLSTKYPNYELVVSEVHDNYNLSFTTFACKGNTLHQTHLPGTFTYVLCQNHSCTLQYE